MELSAAAGAGFTTAGSRSPYPTLTAEPNENPNKFWAIPFVGMFCKEIILIPVAIELVIIEWIVGLMLLINSFVVLFTGRYWSPAYDLTLGFARLALKIQFFGVGITDKYPGFDLGIDDHFSLDIAQPDRCNQLFAFPVAGAVVRWVMLIPFIVWTEIIALGAGVGVVISFVPVLMNGRYPSFAFELFRDAMRLSLSMLFYFAGLSDSYPSFTISWDHKTEKIALIAVGVILFLAYYSTVGSTAGGRHR